jgi:competence ComEA-like helix-hairpin-helix protein
MMKASMDHLKDLVNLALELWPHHSAEELQALYGIGPSLAQTIVEERETNGAFHYPEDLLNVKGIGEKNALAHIAQYGSLNALYEGFEENKSAIRQMILAFKQLHGVEIEYKK